MAKFSSKNVVENSEDDGDSESSLEDIAVLLARKTSEIRAKQGREGLTKFDATPSFHHRSRYKRSPICKTSLAARPKYKYDLKSLAKDAINDDATEASSKKVQEMLASLKKADFQSSSRDKHVSPASGPSQTALFEMYVAGTDTRGPGELKVKRAIETAEANFKKEQWYFFHSESISTISRKPFSTLNIPEDWRNEMANPQLRDSAFISGFTEDLIKLGRPLPDELFAWLVDEICWEENHVLRSSYISALVQSSTDQIRRLINPETIRKLFINLKSRSEGINLSQKIEPVEAIAGYYANRDWSTLISILNFIERMASFLEKETKEQVICILLRMSVDSIIFDTVNIIDSFQKTVNSLCMCTSDQGWDDLCQEICRNLLQCIDQSSVLLQILESIPSASPNSHDLRRRLALCFLFKDLSFSRTRHHMTVSLELFISRLEEADFKRTLDTNYRELKALVMLLNIAIDDGHPHEVDETQKIVEESFNVNVDKLSSSIRKILGAMGTPGDVSKIQAKEVVETISQKIVHTLRTKQKPVYGWSLNHKKKKNDAEEGRRCMESFVTKMRDSKARNN